MKVQVSREVQEALRLRKAVVALESTILCHGMPYPNNVRTALEVEDIIRSSGAVPATIAIIEGVPHVGLGKEEIEMLGKEGHKVKKVSRRDLAYVVASGLHGATTVSATMYLAHLAGIKVSRERGACVYSERTPVALTGLALLDLLLLKVFVTGGIGGVHRGVESTWDVSTDLRELSKTPVCVVCAGVKSILDIPKTLEFLETEGVPVMTAGQDHFPSFFTADSGMRSPMRVDSASQAASVVRAQNDLELGGSLVAVPIPLEDQADAREVENAIEICLERARREGVRGNAITPFILQGVKDLTKGKSLEANIKLVKNNAEFGARLALHLQRLPAKL
ncbi:pseudouridine-5'-phosphate glycosidase [Chloropicon primus]|uniref:Pseudouridine-5'-phosphate glycosidase n=1 Tax=Chloropicon primus TaxID=1764295 RepID=A0A5B8MV39_9CHLO|nr:pseudouridine-5'-phosphate glycosidase [Chloropicon primus]|eukprot:QDZ23362.1 pseudouridine-5'-phosphate glycosidase [Chloropicon primus]